MRHHSGFLVQGEDRKDFMGITRLNHAVLFVRDIERSVAFYTDVLGFRQIDMTPEGFAGAAFLQAPGSTNDHDLGLFEIGANAGPSGAGRTTVRPTTAQRRASTAKTPTGWSLKSPGSFRQIGWTRLPARPASRSIGSTSTRRLPAMAVTPAAGSASRSRSADDVFQLTVDTRPRRAVRLVGEDTVSDN
jgi:catechol 2,3-dioxygenase-like lactoylglutathione lyase family enzyme